MATPIVVVGDKTQLNQKLWLRSRELISWLRVDLEVGINGLLKGSSRACDHDWFILLFTSQHQPQAGSDRTQQQNPNV